MTSITWAQVSLGNALPGYVFSGHVFWPHYVGKFWSWYLQKRLRDFGVLRKLPLWWARGMRPLVRPSALGAGFLVNWVCELPRSLSVCAPRILWVCALPRSLLVYDFVATLSCYST